MVASAGPTRGCGLWNGKPGEACRRTSQAVLTRQGLGPRRFRPVSVEFFWKGDRLALPSSGCDPEWTAVPATPCFWAGGPPACPALSGTWTSVQSSFQVWEGQAPPGAHLSCQPLGWAQVPHCPLACSSLLPTTSLPGLQRACVLAHAAAPGPSALGAEAVHPGLPGKARSSPALEAAHNTSPRHRCPPPCLPWDCVVLSPHPGTRVLCLSSGHRR